MYDYTNPAEAPPDTSSWLAGLTTLGRRWPSLVIGLVLGIALAFFYGSTRHTSYVATSQVSVRNVVENPFSAGQNLDSSISMATERGLASSTSVAAAVQATTGTSLSTNQLLSHLAVQNPPNTLILTFTYSSASPKRAVTFSNAFANQYLAARKAQMQTSLKTTEDALSGRMASLQKHAASFSKQIHSAQGTDKTLLLQQLNGVSAQLTTLQGQIDALAATDLTPGSVIERAVAARTSNMSRSTLLILGAVLGLIIGIVLARARQRTDRRVRSAGDVVTATRAEVLNQRPLHFHRTTGRTASEEVYRSLALLLCSRAGGSGSGPGARIAVVSPRAGEGRTTLAANLSLAVADVGVPSLAVEADFVEPRLAARLGVHDEAGFAAALQAPETSRQPGAAPSRPLPSPVCVPGVQDASDNGLLRVVAAGSVDGRRAKLLGRMSAVGSLITRLQQPGEIALLDTAPLFEVADTLAVVSHVDGALVVAMLGRTRREDLVRLTSTLDSVGVPVVGAVVFRHQTRLMSLLGGFRGHGRGAQGQDGDELEESPAAGKGASGGTVDGRSSGAGKSQTRGGTTAGGQAGTTAARRPGERDGSAAEAGWSEPTTNRTGSVRRTGSSQKSKRSRKPANGTAANGSAANGNSANGSSANGSAVNGKAGRPDTRIEPKAGVVSTRR